ncbi:hypothetical protein FHR75_003892 [Kineococcus radiotolerans]|uniref:Aminoglycoside phosphotransferase domain-containing protein n=1 Tax=Kineococcus radiotolerans TaxID=131568 RepID=A0A7W4TRB1_KINRA|nr:hypothetical protein [Kineococcus radiotolerans]MBB2903056.1 hypothetical protein [Kineococcus radiotolerans]
MNPGEPPVRWRRVWPRRSGDPAAGLVLEGTDAGGRVVAGTADATGAPVRLRTEDPRLPALDRVVDDAAGSVVGHRWGKRAVVRRPDRFVKLATARATRAALDRRATLSAALRGRDGAPDLVDVLRAGEDVLELRPVAGTGLTALLAGGDTAACVRAGRRTARATTALAACGADLPEHDDEAEAAVLTRWVADAEAFGTAPRALRRAAGTALEALRRSHPGPSIPTHRDLHDGQVLLGSRVTFLDVDTAALADPALDVANLLAHLDLAAARGHRAQARAVAEGLWRGWGEHGHPAAGDPARVAALRAVARCRIVAVHSFRGLPPGTAEELLSPCGGADPVLGW